MGFIPKGRNHELTLDLAVRRRRQLPTLQSPARLNIFVRSLFGRPSLWQLSGLHRLALLPVHALARHLDDRRVQKLAAFGQKASVMKGVVEPGEKGFDSSRPLQSFTIRTENLEIDDGGKCLQGISRPAQRRIPILNIPEPRLRSHQSLREPIS